MKPADKYRERMRPQGGRTIPILLLFAPFGDDKRESVIIRRFHSLRSFHPRLFTFAPFGDGRMLLAKLEYFSVSKYDIFKYRIRCIITKKSGIIHAIVCPDFLSFKIFSSENQSLPKINLFRKSIFLFLRCSDKETYQADIGDERANL